MKPAAKTRLSVATGVFNILFALAFMVITGFAVYYVIRFNNAMPDSGFQNNLITFFVGFLLWGVIDILFIGFILCCILGFTLFVATGVVTFICAKTPRSELLKAFQAVSIGISASVLGIFFWFAFVALWHIDDPGAQTDPVTFALFTPLAAIAAVCLVTGAILIAKKKTAVQTAA